MPSLLLNLDKHSHFPYLLDIEMTVFYRDDFLKILYMFQSTRHAQTSDADLWIYLTQKATYLK